MRKAIKIAGLVGSGIVVLVVMLFLCIASGLVNPLIKKGVSSIVNSQLNGTVSIDKISGNVFSDFSIENISVSDDQNQMLEVGNLKINYSLWGIIHKRITIDSLLLSKSSLFLNQESDSLWNIEKLIPPSEPRAEDTLPSKWKLKIAHFQITHFEGEITSLDTSSQLPEKISWNTILALAYEHNNLQLKVKQLNLHTHRPDFQIVDLRLDAHMLDAVFRWSALNLVLPNTRIYSNGSVPLNHMDQTELDLKATPFDLADFSPWVSNVQGQATIVADIKHVGDSSILHLDVNHQAQSLNIKGLLSNFETLPSYAISFNMDSIDLAYWLDNPDYRTNLKGKLKLKGEGLDYKENTLQAKAHFSRLSYDTWDVSDLSIAFEKDQAQINSKMDGNTPYGLVDATMLLQNIFAIPNYELELKLKHLDLAKVTRNELLESDLNLELNAKGRDFHPNKLTTSVQLKSTQSVLFGEPVLDMNAAIRIHPNDFSIKGLHLRTPYLDASVNGRGNFKSENALDFRVKAGRLEHVLLALGQPSFRFAGEVNGRVSGPSDKLKVSANLLVSEFVNDTLSLHNLQSHIQTHLSFNPADSILKEKSTKNYVPTLTFENASFAAETQIGHASYKDYSVHDTYLELEKKRGSIVGRVDANTNIGEIETQFDLANTFSIPEYSVRALIKEFDLAELTKNDSLHTSLNLEILAKGRDIQPDSLRFDMEISSTNSSVFGGPLEDLNSKLVYNQGYYQLKEFEIITPFAELYVLGEGNLSADNHLDFHLKSKGLKELSSVIRPGNLDFIGEIKGSVRGRPDSLNIVSSISGHDFKMDAFRIKNMTADAVLSTQDSTYTGRINMLLTESTMQDIDMDTIQFLSEFNEKNASNSLSYFSSDSLNGRILTDLSFGNVPVLFFKKMEFVFHESVWTGGGDNSFVSFGNDSIEFKNVNVESNESAIRANGIFAFNGSENLDVRVENIDVTGIPGVSLSRLTLGGILNARLNINGSSEEPIIDGYVNLENALLDTFQFQAIGASFSFENEYVNLNSFVDDRNAKLINASCEFPYQLSFSKPMSMPPDDTRIEAHFALNKLDLSRIPGFVSFADIQTKGSLSANINLSNTLENPTLNGNMEVREGDFRYDKLGMFYNNITLSSNFLNNQLQLDSLTFLSSKGKLQFKGQLEIDSLLQGEIKTIDVNMTGKDFVLFDSEIAKALINTNLDINGTSEKPRFKGKLSVLRSSFNVDLFMQEFNRVYDTSEKPMLLVAQEKNQSIAINNNNERDTLKKITPDFYKNLKGYFDIEFPKNTWVKGKNMNFELGGNLKAIKEAEQIDFFGTLNVKRGYYKLYGRRMDFKEGNVTFTGGSSINPKLDFNIAYSFRDPSNAIKTLNVLISDRLLKPTITFFMDELAIEEKEAISYLLFNKGINQLDNRENKTLKSTNLDFALNQISGAVRDVLQSKLGLDVFEIEGNSGWTQSTISTGKYLTNNLYLNYEHTFAIDKRDKVISPQKISLEYQFYRSLFLQATNQSTNSGFDVVLKWSWK